MPKSHMQRNRERIARVREKFLATVSVKARAPQCAYQGRPIDRSTGICYYEFGVGLIDLCHDCATQQGYREPLGGSERRCQECGRPPVREHPHA
jgi:hypothetical protein